MNYKVIQVIPTQNYEVYIYFIDGKVKLFNAKELIKKGIFKQLQNLDLFINSCTVLNDTLAWDLSGQYDPTECLDIDPITLYNESPEVKEPEIVTL